MSAHSYSSPPGVDQAHSHARQYPRPEPSQDPPSQANQDLALSKLTRGTSCVLCQQRKVRCDKNKPCSNCVKAGVDCTVIPPQPPRRRKKRLQEKDLVDRLKKYEELMRESGIKFDEADLGNRGDNGPEDVEDLENDFEGLKTSPEDSTSPASTTTRFRPGPWFSLHKEFRASEKILHDSSDEDVGYSTIHKAFDQMFGQHDIFPFIIGYQRQSVLDAHPSAVHSFQLWQVYIDNVNSLLKITHTPTIQGQVIEAISNLERAPKNIEALMFGIYVMAITSLHDEEVQKRFGSPKKDLLGRFFSGLSQALVNAGFMRTRDPITLQAFILYLFAMRFFMDPRQVFCLLGLAVRMAQQMGLHRDPEGHGLPAFEVEQRRRLWWTIVAYDRRIGEMTGSTVTALSTSCDTKMPLNVNDTDLHVEGTDAPKPHSGPTEMLFALTRIEIAMAVTSETNRDTFNPGNSAVSAERPSPSAQGAKSAPTIKIVGLNGPTYTLEGFCAHMEGTYLVHCDPRIPLHFYTQTMTRQNLCKMRVVSFLVKMLSPAGSVIDDIERENLFLQAIKMVEYDNITQTAESLKAFRWFSMHHFPFPAYMFIVHELRSRTAGPLVERAWDAVNLNYEARGHFNSLHSPMHVAFGAIFIKAWAARAEAEQNAGREVTAPNFIASLKARQEKIRATQTQDPSDHPGLSGPRSFPPSHPPSTAYNTPPPHPAERGGMMTPEHPITSAPGTARQAHGASPWGNDGNDGNDGNEMDWSYLMSSYQNGNLFQGLSGSNDYVAHPSGGLAGNLGPGLSGGLPTNPNSYRGWGDYQ